MEKKWNLQDIRPPERPRRAPRPARVLVSERAASEDEPLRAEPRREKKSGRRRAGFVVLLAFLAIVAVAGVAIAILTAGANVTVFPRFREPTVNATLEAKRQAGAGELAYELLTLEAEGEREVEATGEEEVSTQATGNVTIYNATKDSQRLITNTRFESPDGLIFRIKDPAVIPAATDAGPGSVTAEVFADSTGSQYNLPAGARFKVPGFESSPELYDAIYAENGSDFTGGYEGPRFIIDDEQLSASTESLQSELRQALSGRIESERPAGFTLFSSAVTFVYRDLPPEEVADGKVKLKQKAILQVPIFKNEDFASFIAAAVVPGYEGEPVRINDLSALTFEYATSVADLSAVDSFSFRLTGKPLLVWTFDAEQLKKDLAGGSQTALNTVLGGYPAIERATAAIRPFWQRSFPSDPVDITITESLDQDKPQ